MATILAGDGRTSLRMGSFFKSKIALGKREWLLFSWATDRPSHHMAWHLGVSPRTMVDWTNFIIEVCAEDTRRQQAQLGGFDNAGQAIVVEIDKSYFYSGKYRILNGLWVFGAVERERVLHAASRESQNSADVVVTPPTVVPSWDVVVTHPTVVPSWDARHVR